MVKVVKKVNSDKYFDTEAVVHRIYFFRFEESIVFKVIDKG
jgi:hypothetical protein